MPEQQNIKFKSSWHDDYLKWVCGFANAQGGKIYIGKDDAATVIGLTDYKKLMEDILVFRLYLQMSKEKGRMPDIARLTIEQIFEKLRLTENGQLKRAAIVMFGKDPVRFYPGAFVKCL